MWGLGFFFPTSIFLADFSSSKRCHTRATKCVSCICFQIHMSTQTHEHPNFSLFRKMYEVQSYELYRGISKGYEDVVLFTYITKCQPVPTQISMPLFPPLAVYRRNIFKAWWDLEGSIKETNCDVEEGVCYIFECYTNSSPNRFDS